MQNVSTKREMSQIARLKCFRVLMEIEQSLAQYLITVNCNVDANVRRELSARRSKKGLESPNPSLVELLAETYLDELIQIGLSGSRGTAVEDTFARMKLLCDVNSIFEIRNACAHPNNPFPPYYWYRVASFALDPIFDHLKIGGLAQLVRSAEENRLDLSGDMPKELSDWRPPNNLPAFAPHYITGLVGRSNDLRALRRLLKQNHAKIIALVGPPGVGKTAVLHEFLSSTVSDSTSLVFLDAVVYVSLKTHELTNDGVVTIRDPVVTKAGLQQLLLDALIQVGAVSEKATYSDAMLALASDRYLVCIDNLEALLLQNGEIFDEMVGNFPAGWRAVVSSQIAPEGAQVHRVAPLSTADAVVLARLYCERRGGVSMSPDQYAQLAVVWDGNALAIKLAVEAVVAGVDVAVAISKTKEVFARTAYTALLSALPTIAKRVLECLFASTRWMRSRECALLIQCSHVEVTEAIGCLSRTSLIERRTVGKNDEYQVSGPVNFLLLRSPADYKFRSAVNERIKLGTRQVVTVRKSSYVDVVNKLSYNYLPDDCPGDAAAAAERAFRLARELSSDDENAREEMVTALGLLDDAIENYSELPVLVRARAALLTHLGDRANAIMAIEKAVIENRSDGALLLRRAGDLRGAGLYHEAASVAQLVIQSHVDASTSPSTLRAVSEMLIGCLLSLGDYGAVIRETAQWKTRSADRDIYCAAFVRAVLATEIPDKGTVREALGRTLREVLPALDISFRNDGYWSPTVVAAGEVIRRIRSCLSSELLEPAINTILAEFFANHLQFMVSSGYVGDFDSSRIGGFVEQVATLECSADNPFHDRHWNYLMHGKGQRNLLERKGYIYGRIDRSPVTQGTSSVALFARCRYGQQYYIMSHSLSYSNGERVPREVVPTLRRGDDVMIRPDWASGRMKDQAQPVKSVILLADKGFGTKRG